MSVSRFHDTPLPSAVRLFAGAVALSLFVACGSQTGEVPDPPGVRDDGTGAVIVPEGSPMWERLRIEAVRAEPWSEALELPGRVQADPRRVWRVTLPVSGRVVDVHVSAGDTVRPDQPLLTIVSPEADSALAAVRHAEADQRAADATVRQAQADLERQRDLLAHDAVARRDVLHAETTLVQAEAERARAEAAVAQARDTLALLGVSPGASHSRLIVRAARAGRVTELAVAPGEFHADTSASLLQIADLSTVWVVSDVPEHRVAAIRSNESVDVEFVAFPGQRRSGRIARVANVLDPETRALPLYTELTNAGGGLRPGMFATIRVTGAPRDVPVVPVDAVVRAGHGAVLVVADEAQRSFTSRSVRLGRQRGGRVPVLEGIEPGARVVVDGALLLVNAGLRVAAPIAGSSHREQAEHAFVDARRAQAVEGDR